MFRKKPGQKLPPSEADPLPPPLQQQPGELNDERIQTDQIEGDEGNGSGYLSNSDREKKRPA